MKPHYMVGIIETKLLITSNYICVALGTTNTHIYADYLETRTLKKLNFLFIANKRMR